MHFHQLTADWGANTNGDFSGDVILQHNPNWADFDDGGPEEFRVPFAVLEELVGRKYNSDLISALESLSGIDTLKLKVV